MRLVLDTDVFLAGLRSRRGASRLLLRAGLTEHYHWLMSPALFLEYEAVVTRPENLRALQWTDEDADLLLSGIAEVIRPVSFDFLWRPQLKDAGDEMVLETAVNGQANALVTFNVRHFQPAAGHLGISLLRPGELLARYSEILR